ncbi:MAG: type II secretion system minor pseudopilin GspK [Brevundimonas sp.]|nr:type II secretion system minor pseudopilin GspK [Brevundimonas sp.]
MALLTVLLLVAVMAAVASVVLDDVRFSIRRAANAEVQAQAQFYADGAEALARRQVGRLVSANPTRTPLQPDWNGRRLDFPTDSGAVSAVVRDGQGCFNLNSVVFGQGEDLMIQPEGVAQFVALGRALGVAEGKMRAVADALVDWLDADPAVRPGGAEDARYAGLAEPYRTGGVLLAEVSELRAVQGVDAELYRILRPHLCALPVARLSPVNPNTLTPDQAPILVMLTHGRLTVPAARAVLQARPAEGWATADAFWNQSALRGLVIDEETRGQIRLLTTWFDLRVEVQHAGMRAVRTALISVAPDGRAHTVIRRWTLEE